MKSTEEHKYTSTGVKFWRHPEQMLNYREGCGETAISTHISPEGSCNLNCSYCSVKKRNSRKLRIPLNTIQCYVSELLDRGLKAVILTGGGEPLLYPWINELVEWLLGCGLKIGLITNGTMCDNLQKSNWQQLSWTRVSLNMGYLDKVYLPREYTKDVVVGCSLITERRYDWKEFVDVAVTATCIGAKYIRLLPNCLLDTEDMALEHEWLERITPLLKDTVSSLFFHQHKNHRAPDCRTCHQSYFRPYLSEERYWRTGKPGSVFPCDSVVLNSHAEKFMSKFQLCSPKEIGAFLDGHKLPRFDPRNDCAGCVFTDTVEMLGRWKDRGTVDMLAEYEKPVVHEEFV